ncbi:MAG: ABC transporter ATP-binding protein [Thermoleophilia bacterium]|nr:ABC transporter ATP-binding protein [Thermoleophilia bacterium]MDH4340948.1 ABC transporter ATP-binding protein [Thermoleophilia bacterium]
MSPATPAVPEPVAVLSDLGKTYGEGASAVEALRAASLSIDRGELVVVLGPSGSGKTTLLNLIGALERPSRGTLVVVGRELETLDEGERTSFRREQVGFVFQFFNLVPSLTALENVALVLELTGRDDVERRATHALEAVGLGDRLDHFPAQLSGGEQQRVAIARAVAKDPALVLCDEPTGALDLETGRLVLEELRRLNREDGRTVLMVTHNSAIAAMADRVVRMRSGEIVAVERNEHPVEASQVSW